jgi:hypothetical protein
MDIFLIVIFCSECFSRGSMKLKYRQKNMIEIIP